MVLGETPGRVIQEDVEKHTHLREQLPGFLRVLAMEHGLSENTRKAYQADVDAFLTVLDVQTVTVDDIRAYTRYLHHQGYAGLSIQRKLASIKRFCRYLYLQGVLSSDIAPHIVAPTATRALPRGMTEATARDLLKQPRDEEDRYGIRDRALLWLLYGAGLRVSEICDVTVAQFRPLQALQNTLPSVSHIRVVGKGQKERSVPIPTSVADCVSAYLEGARSQVRGAETTPFLFLSRSGQRLSRQAVFQIVRKYAARMGASDMHPHQLRHAFATHLLNRDANVRDVQECLGHARLSTTQKYLSVSTAHLRKVYENSHPLGQALEKG